MIIIGITGTLGSGKGTIVEYLVSKYGFKHYSVRAYLTEEIERRGMPLNRDSMTVVANDLRTKHGAPYIADQLYDQAAAGGKDSIIESLRAIGEVETLKAKPGKFYLFAVDAPQRTRYDRILLRHSATDLISYDEFLANEERELANADPHKQNLRGCINMADFVFDNSGTFDNLHSQIDNVMPKLEHE